LSLLLWLVAVVRVGEVTHQVTLLLAVEVAQLVTVWYPPQEKRILERVE
jgi:hypothetical protein